MKRIKIMLTAITVLAVVGGALAFKAKKFNSFCFYTSTAINGCDNGVQGFTTTTSGSGTSYYATTKDYDLGCPAGPFNCAVSYYSKGE